MHLTMRTRWLGLVIPMSIVACKDSPPPPPTAPKVTVRLECDHREHALEVTGDLRIDATRCGHPCKVIEVASADRSEQVRDARREVWLRRARERAFVEIRAGGMVTTIDHVQVVTCSALPAPAEKKGLELTIGTQHETLTIAALRERLAAAGINQRALPLCRTAAALAPTYSTIELVADADTFSITRMDCELRGDLVLKLTHRDEVHLRTTSNERILSRIQRIRL